MPSKTLILAAITTLTTIGGIINHLLPPKNPPETVAHVELTRYVGLWYEISSIPFFFGKGCLCSTANYTANSDGTIRVENSCNRDGKRDLAVAKAWTVDSSNSKLKVEFFWPFSADYWIVALDADYKWAVVSNPYRDYLWILSRTPHLEQSEYDTIVAYLKNNGFPVDQLVVTSTNC